MFARYHRWARPCKYVGLVGFTRFSEDSGFLNRQVRQMWQIFPKQFHSD